MSLGVQIRGRKETPTMNDIIQTAEIASAAAPAALAVAPVAPGRPDLDLPELLARLASSTPPVLVEVLGPKYFESGHLPGAVNLGLEGFVENAARLLPDRAAEIVLY